MNGPGPSLTLVSGPRRAGKTTLLREALADTDVLWYQAGPLPDPDQRTLFAQRLRAVVEAAADEEPERSDGGSSAGRRWSSGSWPDGDAEGISDGADWPELFTALAEHLYVSHRRAVVVLEGWHHLVEARSRVVRHLTEFWLEVRRRGVPLHLVLTSVPGDAAESLRDPENPPGRWVDEDLRLGPLPYRDVAAYPRGLDAGERLEWFGVFGGWPGVLRQLDPTRSVEENVREAVLAPEAPLFEWGTDLLARQIQAPARYASILRALAEGAREWGQIRERVPDFGSSGQMAPYLQRLEAMELISVDRSLDASPDSRSRRYRIVDPFPAFWFRFVLPNRTELELGRTGEVWKERVRPVLDRHLSALFPHLCREYLASHGDEALPARAREVGGLWGRDYDLDVAATLTNGSVVYGRAFWSAPGDAEEVDEEIARRVDRTRYGFGREGRHRLVFTRAPPAPSLRRHAAREPFFHVVGPQALVGERS